MTSPAELAGQAAEAVRALNHATLPAAGGLQYPADAYEVTGELAVPAARLPQALAQLLAFLQDQAAAGRIQVVAGQHQGDPAAMLAALTGDLDAAVASACRLHQALDAAQNHLTWAAGARAVARSLAARGGGPPARQGRRRPGDPGARPCYLYS